MDSQNMPRDCGKIHQTVNHLVQCTVPTGSNQQIHFACFRHKSSRISLFQSHSYFDAVPGCSLPLNCGLECVIAGRFAVENQLNFFTHRLWIPSVALLLTVPFRFECWMRPLLTRLSPSL